MKKTVKYLIFALSVHLSCAGMFMGRAMAGAVESPTEFSGVIAMFVQKLEKINAYKDEIQKTLDVKSTFGELGVNAASKMLSQGSGLMGPFQDSLHFGDLGNISSLVGDVQGQVNGLQSQVSDLQGQVDSVKGQVQGAVSDAQGQLSDIKNQATDKLSSVADSAKGSLGGTGTNSTGSSGVATSDGAVSSASSNPKSSLSKVRNVTGSYGAPQSSKDAAQKYIKEAFFYSVREGDKSTGDTLQETDAAHKKVNANRKGYYREIIAAALGQANEAINTNYEESQSRMEKVMSQAQSAETYDDKKAAESVITQNDTRERMIRLSLELSTLEQDVVSMLMYEPADYLIPRSADEIRAETTAQMQTVDYKTANEGSAK